MMEQNAELERFIQICRSAQENRRGLIATLQNGLSETEELIARLELEKERLIGYPDFEHPDQE